MVFPNPIATIPSGFMYAAKRFRKNGFEVKILINSFLDFKTMDEYYEEICQENPDIVGFSFATLNLLEIYRLQKMLNKAGFVVISGGPHPTICPDEVLKNGAHFVVIGEGEIAIDGFCNWFIGGKINEAKKSISSVSFIENGEIVRNNASSRIKDLDSVGDLDVEGLDLTAFTLIDGSVKGLNHILGGRGCPFNCSFCSHNAWMKYNCRSVDAMIDDMVERRHKYNIKSFWISDETFSVQKERAVEFCERMIKEKFDFTWMAQTRVSCTDEKLLQLLKRAGCSQINVGIESADGYTLKKINKGHTVEQINNFVSTAAKYGLQLYVNMMTGFPWQTVDSVRNDIKFIREMGKYISCFTLHGSVIPYPDTHIYTEYSKKYSITEFWLMPKYQNAGLCIYQNVPNPYAVSTFWQRNLYDDTYVCEEYFFKFTQEYKRWVAYMGALTGYHSVVAASNISWKAYLRYIIGVSSRLLYEMSPTIEKRIVGKVPIKNALHEKRATGIFLKH